VPHWTLWRSAAATSQRQWNPFTNRLATIKRLKAIAVCSTKSMRTISGKPASNPTNSRPIYFGTFDLSRSLSSPIILIVVFKGLSGPYSTLYNYLNDFDTWKHPSIVSSDLNNFFQLLIKITNIEFENNSSIETRTIYIVRILFSFVVSRLSPFPWRQCYYFVSFHLRSME
jgi:hypothetical protein